MHPGVWRGFVSEISKIAGQGEKRWESVIIESPLASLTKKDVFNYYSEPRIRAAVLKDLAGREAIVRQNFTPEFVILKRKEGKNLIRIEQDKKDVNNPKDFSYYIERRTTEFHPVFKTTEPRVVVDLDPRPQFPFEETKRYAGQIADLLKSRFPGVTSTEIRYSGGRGFYVIGNLQKPVHVDKSRRMLKDLLAPLTEADERLTVGVPSTSEQMRLDISPLKRRGSVRGLYSLNANTGLVSVPVKDLAAFDPKKDATIEAVLGRKPREARHVR